MHCDMLKIQDGVAIVEKLNYKNIYYLISHIDSQLVYVFKQAIYIKTCYFEASLIWS